MAYVIAEPCIGVKDTACVDACPVDCIHPKKDETVFSAETQLYIDPMECIDCGACGPVCPVSAIFSLEICRSDGSVLNKLTLSTSAKRKPECPCPSRSRQIYSSTRSGGYQIVIAASTRRIEYSRKTTKPRKGRTRNGARRVDRTRAPTNGSANKPPLSLCADSASSPGFVYHQAASVPITRVFEGQDLFVARVAATGPETKNLRRA